MPHKKHHGKQGETVGFVTYMKKFNKERDHVSKLEQQRTMMEREADWDQALAEDETVGYRRYMEIVDRKKKKEGRRREKVQSVISHMAEQEKEHARKHALLTDPLHHHTPRKNQRGALEDGEVETRVICPTEYRRLIDEISAILSAAIEMVQVVMGNEKISYGSRLHRYVDHTLTSYLIRLTELKTLQNEDVTRYQQFAIHQLQYTINQINTMFWKISQIKSEKPKKYKIQKDLLNKWGDTKYSRAKHDDRPGLGVPASLPFEFYVPGEGFISPYKSKASYFGVGHGTYYPDELGQLHQHHQTGKKTHAKLKGGLKSLDEAFYGSGEYFQKHPYIGHDHWGTLGKLDLGPDVKLEYPKK